MRTAAKTVLTRILTDPPRRFRTVVITNASADAEHPGKSDEFFGVHLGAELRHVRKSENIRSVEQVTASCGKAQNRRVVFVPTERPGPN